MTGLPVEELHALPYVPEPEHGGAVAHVNDAEIEYDNLIVAELKVKGYKDAEIAALTGLSAVTVSKKWSSILAHWRKKRLQLVDTYENQELFKLDQLESEYWQSFRQSKKGVELVDVSDSAQNGGQKYVLIETPGDARYLDGVLKVMQDRAKRLGLYDAERKLGALADAATRIITLPEGASAADIAAIANYIERGSISEDTDPEES